MELGRSPLVHRRTRLLRRLGNHKEKDVRKLILIALAGAGIAVAAPQLASATPLSPGGGLTTAADSVSTTEQVWHRHCHHRRHWSGRRCW